MGIRRKARERALRSSGPDVQMQHIVYPGGGSDKLLGVGLPNRRRLTSGARVEWIVRRMGWRFTSPQGPVRPCAGRRLLPTLRVPLGGLGDITLVAMGCVGGRCASQRSRSPRRASWLDIVSPL